MRIKKYNKSRVLRNLLPKEAEMKKMLVEGCTYHEVARRFNLSTSNYVSIMCDPDNRHHKEFLELKQKWRKRLQYFNETNENIDIENQGEDSTPGLTAVGVDNNCGMTSGGYRPYLISEDDLIKILSSVIDLTARVNELESTLSRIGVSDE